MVGRAYADGTDERVERLVNLSDEVWSYGYAVVSQGFSRRPRSLLPEKYYRLQDYSSIYNLRIEFISVQVTTLNCEADKKAALDVCEVA